MHYFSSLCCSTVCSHSSHGKRSLALWRYPQPHQQAQFLSLTQGQVPALPASESQPLSTVSSSLPAPDAPIPETNDHPIDKPAIEATPEADWTPDALIPETSNSLLISLHPSQPPILVPFLRQRLQRILQCSPQARLPMRPKLMRSGSI